MLKTKEELKKLSESEKYDYYLQNKICFICDEPIRDDQHSCELIFKRAGGEDEYHYLAHVKNDSGKVCMNFLLGDFLDKTTPSVTVYPDE